MHKKQLLSCPLSRNKPNMKLKKKLTTASKGIKFPAGESESRSVYIVREIFQARTLEWVAFPFSRGSSQPKDQTQVSHNAGRFFISWATKEAQEFWSGQPIPSPEDLPNSDAEPGSPTLQADSLPTELSGKPYSLQVEITKLSPLEDRINISPNGNISQPTPSFPTEADIPYGSFRPSQLTALSGLWQHDRVLSPRLGFPCCMCILEVGGMNTFWKTGSTGKIYPLLFSPCRADLQDLSGRRCTDGAIACTT